MIYTCLYPIKLYFLNSLDRDASGIYDKFWSHWLYRKQGLGFVLLGLTLVSSEIYLNTRGKKEGGEVVVF